jgi:hypothetical protein
LIFKIGVPIIENESVLAAVF